ncbi:TPA: DUF262 domain-containing protein [Morganella morganii subsp. morganii]|uniref:DUF262 domain-containing protein n=1 Tax=Morganella morganii TaxID=582 RepID=UPI00277C7DF8|nr:DUF262 domain-containing protein [Morganella morganii]HDS2970844.1 DUF262 domain-containing protein [Morganella morganii subsp. morganii]HDS6885805.1 DUF262 domain-containing protein [Morganella morganii subsp. morganii]
MQILNNSYSISELMAMLARRDLVINEKYQRGAGLWPVGPASYFIDTILEGYPFPKIYLYEFFNRDERITRREIVDGQQRVTTIRNFISNKFKISGDSKFSGLYFRDLDEETQEKFMTYSVSADVIRSANRAEILQMFRRMNAYTLPLNEAEKRHAAFTGEFKFFINEISDSLNEFFVEFGVFTDREILRMKDAELLSEIVLSIENGIVSLSSAQLNSLYKKYDAEFATRHEYLNKITEAFSFVIAELEPLRNSFMMKSYALHSLIIALIAAKYGIAEMREDFNAEPINTFTTDIDMARERLIALALAHEAKEVDGPYGFYVKATTSSTTKAPNRKIRTAVILEALGVNVSYDNYEHVF